MDDYQFLITSLTTGRTVDEFEPQSFGWTEVLNRPGAGRCTVRIDDPKTNQANFDSWRNAIWCMRNGWPQWGGIMGGVSPIASTRALTVPIYGFPEYARWRVMRDTTDMIHINNTLVNTIKWEQQDAFHIVDDMYAHLNAFGGIVPAMGVQYEGVSGILRDMTYYPFEHKFIGEAMEQLADSEEGFGFDWRPMFSIVDGKPKCDIFLSVRQGIRRPYVLEFDYDPGNPNIMDFDAAALPRPVNSVFAAGEGEGDAMLRSHIVDASSPYPLYEGLISYKDVKQQDTLDAHANKHLERNHIPIATVKGELDQHATPKYYEFIVGDTMRTRVFDGWLQYDDIYRVVQKDVLFTKELNVTCSIGMELVGS